MFYGIKCGVRLNRKIVKIFHSETYLKAKFQRIIWPYVILQIERWNFVLEILYSPWMNPLSVLYYNTYTGTPK